MRVVRSYPDRVVIITDDKTRYKIADKSYGLEITRNHPDDGCSPALYVEQTGISNQIRIVSKPNLVDVTFVDLEDGTYEHYVCSECDCDDIQKGFKYCPECGRPINQAGFTK